MKHTTEIETIFAGFLPWVQGRPADETYDYIQPTNCAFAQYLKALGFRRVSVGASDFCMRSKGLFARSREHDLPRFISRALNSSDNTFGALAKRLVAFK